MQKLDTRKLKLALVIFFICSGMTLASATGQNPKDVDALKKEIAALQAKVMELERKLENQQPAAMTVRPQAMAPVSPVTTFDALDPFAEMEAMQEKISAIMARQFDSGFGPGFMGISRMPMTGANFSFHPDYDIKANATAYVVTFDMPGMDKSKINVEVKEGVLYVSGERSSENRESSGNRFYRQQRSFGYFSRAIPLPGDAKADSVQAQYDNGVLTVTIDKKEALPKAKDNSQKIEVK